MTAIPAAETHLELTDGWYSVRTVVDPALASFVEEGKLRVGKFCQDTEQKSLSEIYRLSDTQRSRKEQ